MINLLYEQLKKISTWKSILIFGILFIILLVIINGKPFGVAELKDYSGGVGILDLERSYTPQYAYKILDLLGDKGRQFYLKILIIDFVFLSVYALFWSLLLVFIFRKWLSIKNRWQKLGLLPLVAGISDFLENILILFMLFNYPKRFFGVAIMANAMTVSKEIFTILSLILIAIGLIGLSVKAIFLKKIEFVK